MSQKWRGEPRKPHELHNRTDNITRITANHLSQRIGKPVVVDN